MWLCTSQVHRLRALVVITYHGVIVRKILRSPCEMKIFCQIKMDFLRVRIKAE